MHGDDPRDLLSPDEVVRGLSDVGWADYASAARRSEDAELTRGDAELTRTVDAGELQRAIQATNVRVEQLRQRLEALRADEALGADIATAERDYERALDDAAGLDRLRRLRQREADRGLEL